MFRSSEEKGPVEGIERSRREVSNTAINVTTRLENGRDMMHWLKSALSERLYVAIDTMTIT